MIGHTFPHERFEARINHAVCCIERADSRDRGPSTGNRGGGGRGNTGGGGSSSGGTKGAISPGAALRGSGVVNNVGSPHSPTPAGKQTASASRGVFNGGSVSAPASNALPSNVVPSPPPGQVGQYSPSYGLDATDRMLQALGIGLDVVTGGVFGVAGQIAADVMGFNGPMTAPRGYTRDPSKGVSGNAKGVTLRGAAPSVVPVAPVIPQPINRDTFFSFFNPGV